MVAILLLLLRLNMKVGKIIEVSKHPNSDKVIALQTIRSFMLLKAMAKRLTLLFANALMSVKERATTIAF